MNMKTKAAFKGKGAGDLLFSGGTLLCALLVAALMAGIFVELVRNSRLSLERFGLSFLASTAWNPVTGDFGAASSIFGTFLSSLIAMAVALPLSLAAAIFLVETAPPWIARLVGGAIELLAAVPSIIYGMWGLFVFAPFMADRVQPFLGRTFGFLPFFKGPPMGIGMLTSGIILALMILPFITAVTCDVLRMVPPVLKESACGLGSTTWETTRHVSFRYGLKGIAGATLLGLSRALGETMAVTFVIGNDHKISPSLFAAGNSIASTLANEFTEASDPLYLSALVELGLVLLLITILLQAAAQLWLKRLGKAGEAAR